MEYAIQSHKSFPMYRRTFLLHYSSILSADSFFEVEISAEAEEGAFLNSLLASGARLGNDRNKGFRRKEDISRSLLTSSILRVVGLQMFSSQSRFLYA